jgi:signal transduction histidine kinase
VSPSPDPGVRRRSFGLRPRLLLALVVTSAATLLAAALVLLSPLQDRLREQSRQNLRAAVLTAKPGFTQALRESGGTIDFDVASLAFGLSRRTGSRIVITDSIPRRIYDSGSGPDSERDLLRTLITRETETQVDPDGGTRVSTLIRANGSDHVLAARRTPDDAEEVVRTVRDAFLRAALIGLGVALVLGLALVTTLTRRLERLRWTAMRIAEEGPDAPPPVTDRTGDEVGDLGRALAAMQSALGRQEQARRSFVATASHELRTPLTSLGGALELLGEDLSEADVDLQDARAQLTLARGEVGRLAHLASDLLDLSRIDSDQPLRSEPVELLESCRAVAAEFAARASASEIELAVPPPPGPCWTRGDPGAVARIVRILLDNALRVAPPGTTVTVRAGYHGDAATVDVIDAGPGVPEADRERIFERFERGSAPSGNGFGLGLAIGRELAERQGGRLELLDADPAGGAGGTRFRLTLPVEDLA